MRKLALVLALASLLVLPQLRHVSAQTVRALTLKTASPTTAPALSKNLAVQLTGTGFNMRTVATINDLPIAIRLLDPYGTQAEVFIPSQLLVAPTHLTIVVTNPQPLLPAPSISIAFTVGNPVPTISSVSPASLSMWKTGAITVTGTGIGPLSTGKLGTAVGILSGSTMVFGDLSPDSTGTLSGVISNPAPAGGSASFKVNVVNPVPITGEITTVAGSAILGLSYTIRVKGAGFVPTTVVEAAPGCGDSRTAIPTTPTSSELLTAIIPAGWPASGVYNQFVVCNPPPGGGATSAFLLSSPFGTPQLSAITPAAVVRSVGSIQVVLTGSSLNPATIVRAGSTTLSTQMECTAHNTVNNNSCTNFAIHVTIPPALQAAGSLALTAANPAAAPSNAIVLQINSH